MAWWTNSDDLTKAERRAADAVREASQSTLDHLHRLDRSIRQLQDMLDQMSDLADFNRSCTSALRQLQEMLDQMSDLREQTIRQARPDIVHQWRTERETEKMTGMIRLSWSEPHVLVDES